MHSETPDRTFRIRDILDLPSGTVVISDRDFRAPVKEEFVPQGAIWIDMCLTPRPEKLEVCYHRRWPSHRYEKVGQVFVMPAGEPMRFRGTAGSQTSVVCQLQPERLEHLYAIDFEWTDRRLEVCLDLPNPRLSTALRHLAEEVRRPNMAREAMAELILGQVVIELARHMRKIDEPVAVGGLATWRLKLIDDRLLEPGAAPSLDDLAILTALSVRQLTRAFRVSRGCSLGEHIADFRIERAKRMLAGTDSIKAIAFQLGFRSAANFSQAFRQRAGMTPRQFRAQARTVMPAS